MGGANTTAPKEMKLVSNFSDYYDHHFDLNGPEFRRMGTEGPNRIEQFALLEGMGLSTPPHGLVKDVMEIWWEAEQHWVRWLVVYHDLNAHGGDGKRLTQTSRFKWDGCISRLEELDRQCNTLFCSAYVGRFGAPSWTGVSWRMLQVGMHRFWIEYRAKDDWRSNCGEGDCEVFQVELDIGPHFGMDRPLFAVDFVLGKATAYAVDLNFAPGIRGSGVEKYLSPKAAVEAIKNYAQTHSRQPAPNPFQQAAQPQ